MWQSIVILVVIAAVSVYVARHFFRVLRGSKSHCGCCSECQALSTVESLDGPPKNPLPGTEKTATPSPSSGHSCCEERS